MAGRAGVRIGKRHVSQKDRRLYRKWVQWLRDSGLSTAEIARAAGYGTGESAYGSSGFTYGLRKDAFTQARVDDLRTYIEANYPDVGTPEEIAVGVRLPRGPHTNGRKRASKRVKRAKAARRTSSTSEALVAVDHRIGELENKISELHALRALLIETMEA